MEGVRGGGVPRVLQDLMNIKLHNFRGKKERKRERKPERTELPEVSVHNGISVVLVTNCSNSKRKSTHTN